MSNGIQNSHHNNFLSYNHHTTLINEYNSPHLTTYIFPTLFPVGIGCPKMNNIPIKISVHTHETFNKLNEIHYKF
jgi:hypothetical protein